MNSGSSSARQSLSGVVRIEEGWHTNSHQPTYDYLIPTTLTVTVPAGWPEARVEYPAGATKKFGFAEEPLSVYDGVLDIPVLIDVPASAAGGPVAISAVLRYQACDDRSCLPPVNTETKSLSERFASWFNRLLQPSNLPLYKESPGGDGLIYCFATD